MNFEIVQLGRQDFEEAMDFINMVFSMSHTSTDFPELLPTYYKSTEEHMKCNYAVKYEGRIKAMVGIYPGEMKIGKEICRVARIGAVSVHPYYRNRGFMKLLMEHCMNIVKVQGYDLASLGGLRQRYMNYGFEKCGNKVVFKFNRHNLKYNKNEIDDIYVENIKDREDSRIEVIKEMHDKKVIRFNRDSKNFFDICSNWKHSLYVGCKGQELIGYLVSDTRTGNIYEFAGKDNSMIISMLKKYFEISGKEEISIEVGPCENNIIQRLGMFCENVEIGNAGNWFVLNWEKVLESLLKVKEKYLVLPEGEIIIGIIGYGNIKIWKDKRGFSCSRTGKEAFISLDPFAAARLFFGPLQPYLTVEYHAVSGVINTWFPLPLCTSEQDFA